MIKLLQNILKSIKEKDSISCTVSLGPLWWSAPFHCKSLEKEVQDRDLSDSLINITLALTAKTSNEALKKPSQIP